MNNELLLETAYAAARKVSDLVHNQGYPINRMELGQLTSLVNSYEFRTAYRKAFGMLPEKVPNV